MKISKNFLNKFYFLMSICCISSVYAGDPIDPDSVTLNDLFKNQLQLGQITQDQINEMQKQSDVLLNAMNKNPDDEIIKKEFFELTAKIQEMLK